MSLYLERLRDAIRPPSHVECADRALAKTVKRNDELVEIMRKVRSIHVEETFMGVGLCFECKRRYPCPTLKALDGEATTQHESEVD